MLLHCRKKKRHWIAGFVNIRETHIMLIYVISHVFDSDPRNSRGSLGDDHLKSFDYMLPNVRKGFENYYELVLPRKTVIF